LLSNTSGNLQWYRNGELIIGATDTIYSTTLSGSYTAIVTTSGRCGVSQPLFVTVKESPPKPQIYWNSIKLNTDEGYSFYQWYLNGTAIAGASTSSYQPEPGKAGLYKVTVRDFSNCSNTSDEFNLVITGITDVVIGDTKIRYFPNPVQKMLYLDIPNARINKIRAELYDIKGRVVGKHSLNQNHNEMSVQHLSSGVYQLILFKGFDKMAVKIIVIK